MIEKSNVQSYKNFIKAKIKIAALKFLNERKSTHSKVKDIEYSNLETQKYLKSPLFSDSEVSLLFSLRSKYIQFKSNFKSMYNEEDMSCPLCEQDIDNQKHILKCSVLSAHHKTREVAEMKLSMKTSLGM